MKGIYYGLDGGGTRCRLAIWNEEKQIIYQDEGASSNPYAVGFEQAAKNVLLLLDKARGQQILQGMSIKAFCFGSAGLARQVEQAKWKAVFDSYFMEDFPRVLVSDAEILLTGSHLDVSGIALIAGTGSICMGRNDRGETVRSGGLGSALGDEGSAWWIAIQAVRRTLRSKEGRDLETTMDGTIRSFFHLGDLQECVPFFNDKNLAKATVAQFAPYVTSFADKGDPLAKAILKEAAEELVHLVISVQSRLAMPFRQRLTLAGGVLEQDKTIRALFLKGLPSEIVVCPTKGTALEGALVLAYACHERVYL
ncbi:N-acetylglucosamine kinase [Sphaerochaeta sp. PS]|uniref:N-acetylglucosamine kinase n=1 Tax=Sphaerochaeta sp. PS TaxID=3076336 RepID=UPI0028A3BDEC|nr:BadF/BadG/BcrA/BcrD ATPase family protein [Sphaerochaeta sp. PS]MDT4762143.1 BadF/BadG/BcrA/BcrD ATPase family protein [Sphaerochaeta sp. PS]